MKASKERTPTIINRLVTEVESILFGPIVGSRSALIAFIVHLNIHPLASAWSSGRTALSS
jgi:hypothetical protein